MKSSKPNSSLSAKIADAIRTAIVDGRLLVGDRLPSEAELADQHGVSRATVREALKRLAAQSLIRTERGASVGPSSTICPTKRRAHSRSQLPRFFWA